MGPPSSYTRIQFKSVTPESGSRGERTSEAHYRIESDVLFETLFKNHIEATFDIFRKIRKLIIRRIMM
jgi:hypothetical protein